jgi:hypothetical protein
MPQQELDLIEIAAVLAAELMVWSAAYNPDHSGI